METGGSIKPGSIPDLEPVEIFDWLPAALFILLWQLANACTRGCD